MLQYVIVKAFKYENGNTNCAILSEENKQLIFDTIEKACYEINRRKKLADFGNYVASRHFFILTKSEADDIFGTLSNTDWRTFDCVINACLKIKISERFLADKVFTALSINEFNKILEEKHAKSIRYIKQLKEFQKLVERTLKELEKEIEE